MRTLQLCGRHARGSMPKCRRRRDSSTSTARPPLSTASARSPSGVWRRRVQRRTRRTPGFAPLSTTSRRSAQRTPTLPQSSALQSAAADAAPEPPAPTGQAQPTSRRPQHADLPIVATAADFGTRVLPRLADSRAGYDTDATEPSGEIDQHVRGLGRNTSRIYNWVRANITFTPTWGSPNKARVAVGCRVSATPMTARRCSSPRCGAQACRHASCSVS